MIALMTALITATLLATAVIAGDTGNRLVALDEPCAPYMVGLETPKLTTSQWVGAEGVEAVIVLAVDDLQDPAKYEQYIRPIVRRLKHFDTDAGMSLMATRVDAADPQLQTWLAEGVTVEPHTADHPCPCLQGKDLPAAKATDSMNSVSPRFFTEVFNRTTAGGYFQTIDSSIFHIFSGNDPALPRQLAFDQPGRERFRKYVPTDRGMVNLIEDYPYPFVIGRLCWEIPCLMPSDWDAQHLNGKCSPATVVDLKAAVDATVIKGGIFSLCFHPHGWIRNDQVVEVINHAFARHGKKVKFLSFRQVQDRLDRNLLGGHSLRGEKGRDNGVRLLDLDNDGSLDVVTGNRQCRQMRIWTPATDSKPTGSWRTAPFPVELVGADQQGAARESGVRFGVLQKSGYASLLVRNETVAGLWHFNGREWIEVPDGLAGLELDGPIHTSQGGRDRGVRLRDLDGDGISELIVGNPEQNGVFAWSTDRNGWQRLPIGLPAGTWFVDAAGRDAGLRMVDVDEDGRADVLFSNAQRYSLHQFTGIEQGWSRQIVAGGKDDKDRIPMVVRADGSNNGAWFGYRQMWVQNEETGKRQPNHVDGRSFAELLLSDK
jgi:VCBS repeat protein